MTPSGNVPRRAAPWVPLRIAGAAVVFAVWRRPWRLVRRLKPRQRRVLLELGVVLAAMNATFYLAIARLPLATVGAIEFLGTIMLAAIGVRSGRNVIALMLTVGGVVALTDIQLAGAPFGFVFAFVNCALFMLYVVLGHRIANTGGGPSGIDQLAMARLRRDTFALMLCILPAVATVIGIVVLTQVPTLQELTGIALIAAGVSVHQEPPDSKEN
jgi:inner membrane transporter RhtA